MADEINSIGSTNATTPISDQSDLMLFYTSLGPSRRRVGVAVPPSPTGDPSQRSSTHIERTEYIEPTGDAVTDVRNLKAAIRRIQRIGQGLIRLVEAGSTLAINKTIEFGGVSLIGSNRSTITLSNGAELVFGTYLEPHSKVAPYVVVGTPVPAGISKGSNRIVIPPGMTLARDDVVLMFAENDLVNEFVSHNYDVGGKNCPGEIFRVLEVGGQYAYFDTEAIDEMSTTLGVPARIHKLHGSMLNSEFRAVPDVNLPPARRLRIENFQLLSGAVSSDPYPGGISLNQCVDTIIQGVGIFGAGQLTISYCDSVIVRDCFMPRMVQTNGAQVYGIDLAINSNVLVTGNTVGFCRHAITTGGWSGPGTGTLAKRFGMGKGFRVVDNMFKGQGEIALGTAAEGGVVVCDTHAETYGMVFEGNTVLAGKQPGTPLIYAFSIRARKTVIRNNYIKVDAPYGTACQFVAPDGVFENNFVDGGYVGVCNDHQQKTAGQAQTDRTIIKGNVFKHLYAPAVLIKGGRGIQVVDNLMAETAYGGSGSKVAFLVPDPDLITGGTTAATRNVIRNNQMDKDLNAYSVDNLKDAATDHLMIVGNTMRGYGPGNIGTKNHGAAFNAGYAAKNYTD